VKLETAKVLAEQIRSALQQYCERIEIAGSIRRQKAEVGDIDLVLIPRSGRYYCGLGFDAKFSAGKVWAELIPAALKRNGLRQTEAGDELQHFLFADNFQVDLYRARQETWGVIMLVRTGSKEHNVKLCTIARSKGLMLSAKQGVIRPAPPKPCEGLCLEVQGEVLASRSEESIFAVLGLAFVKPEFREALP
jgi:DNA polymerase (family 10)